MIYIQIQIVFVLIYYLYSCTSRLIKCYVYISVSKVNCQYRANFKNYNHKNNFLENSSDWRHWVHFQNFTFSSWLSIWLEKCCRRLLKWNANHFYGLTAIVIEFDIMTTVHNKGTALVDRHIVLSKHRYLRYYNVKQ